MARIAVVTDSVACVPHEQAARYSIHVIPVRVRIGDAVYTDSALDLPQETLRRLQGEPAIDTTPWPPEHYCRAYIDLAQRADHVVHVVAFSRFTSTADLARIGAAMARERVPNLSVDVVDSGTTGMAQGFVALAAARRAAAGADPASVVAIAEKARTRVCSVFALQSLVHLARTGRVGRLYSWAGSLLKVTPVVGLYDGREHPIALTRSSAQATRRILTFIDGYAHRGSKLQTAVMHAGRAADAARLADSLSQRPDVGACFIAEFTPVMQLVAGPGVVGVALLDDTESEI